MAGRSIVPRRVSDGNVLQASQFFADVTRPNMTDFDFDLDNGVLTLLFDETLNTSSLVLTDINLQSTMTSRTVSVQLTGGSVDRSSDTHNISVTLSLADLNEVKRLAVCTQPSRLLHFLCANVRQGRFLQRNFPQSCRCQRNLCEISSTTRPPPELQRFVHFNLELGTAELSFSETVLVSSLNYSLLTLQQLSGSGSLGIVTLSGGSTTSTDGTVVLVKLPKADLDSVKLETQLLHCCFRVSRHFPVCLCHGHGWQQHPGCYHRQGRPSPINVFGSSVFFVFLSLFNEKSSCSFSNISNFLLALCVDDQTAQQRWNISTLELTVLHQCHISQSTAQRFVFGV